MNGLIREKTLFVLICLGVLSASPAHAAQAPIQNQYRIEVIVFANNNPNNFVEEEWPQSIPSPDISKAVALFDGQQSPGFKVLPAKDYALDDEARRLQDSGHYTVLAHVAWEQPGLTFNQAIPVSLEAGRDYAPLYPALTTPRYVSQNGQTVEIPAPVHLYRLSGTIKVVLSHYLHFYTNLALNVPTSPQTATDGSTSLIEDTDVIHNPAAQPSLNGTLTQVHMIQQRRTRSRLLNYMDNPLLGVLFEIWPIGNSR